MTKVFTLLALIGLAVVGGTISPAQATLVIDNSGDNPVLLGATEVNVDGILYNVTFEDGTCAAVFGTCDENGFEFDDFNTARSAGQALLDQVFVDDPLLGLFDTRPELAFGCESLGGDCITLIPYLIEAGRLFNIAVKNAGTFETADNVGENNPNPSIDYTTIDNFNFAKFTLAPVPVPEPSTLTLLVTGLAGLGFMMRRRRSMKLKAA